MDRLDEFRCYRGINILGIGMRPLLHESKCLTLISMTTTWTLRSLWSDQLSITYLFSITLCREDSCRCLRWGLCDPRLAAGEARANLRIVPWDMGCLYSLFWHPIWPLLNKFRRYSSHFQVFPSPQSRSLYLRLWLRNRFDRLRWHTFWHNFGEFLW